MKINRYVFPLIVLAVFVIVIGGAMVLGFWQTKGGQGRGGEGNHEEGTLTPVIEMVAQTNSIRLFEEVTL